MRSSQKNAHPRHGDTLKFSSLPRRYPSREGHPALHDGGPFFDGESRTPKRIWRCSETRGFCPTATSRPSPRRGRPRTPAPPAIGTAFIRPHPGRRATPSAAMATRLRAARSTLSGDADGGRGEGSLSLAERTAPHPQRGDGGGGPSLSAGKFKPWRSSWDARIPNTAASAPLPPPRPRPRPARRWQGADEEQRVVHQSRGRRAGRA